MAVLKEGSKAPVFKAVDQNGKPISLNDFKGKKVILYFYPKDDTPGCTAQACNLKDNYSALIKKGFQVVGVSTDSVASHKKFEEKFELPFPLVSDEDKKIVDKYNLWVVPIWVPPEPLSSLTRRVKLSKSLPSQTPRTIQKKFWRLGPNWDRTKG
jgi:peroxiredoxin